MTAIVAAMAIDHRQAAQTRHFIAEWLQVLGWTQERLAGEMGVHKSTISRYVRNLRGLKVAELGLVASALGIQATDLLEDPAVFSAARALRALAPTEREHVQETILLLQRHSQDPGKGSDRR